MQRGYTKLMQEYFEKYKILYKYKHNTKGDT